MSRQIKIGESKAKATARVPPGAYISRFYHADELTATTSGVDLHPTGATLLQVHAILVTPSDSGDVTLALKKNDIGFVEFAISEEERMSDRVHLRGIESLGDGPSVSMTFSRTDELQVEIVETGSGASTLTVFGAFDR